MKKKVSYRKKTEYMAESGQHIEEWKRAGEAEINIEGKYPAFDDEVLYYGSATIQVGKPQMVPDGQGGIQMAMIPEPKEIKFSIPGAKTVEEALQMFDEAVQDTLKQLEEAHEEARKQAQSHIITAPGTALQEIDNMNKIITD